MIAAHSTNHVRNVGLAEFEITILSTIQRFEPGDLVSHPKRPQWGGGVVKKADAIHHQGQRVQRLTVDFANHGRVVINTAVATLLAKKETNSMTANATGKDKGWLDQLEQTQGLKSHELWELPDAMTDPFATESMRLTATLESYRHSTEARSLIDWAITQTGLDDPMTRYTRQELEQNFQRFARNRDQHLKELVRNMKRMGQQNQIQQVMSKLPDATARDALKKALRT